MSDEDRNPGDAGTGEASKPSQAEAIKRILERKKQAQRQGGNQAYSNQTKQMKTQIHKVQNNQKRRTGV
jgi:hypothetical protein